MDRFGLSAQFDFNSGNSANQITGVSNSIAGLIDTIQDLEKAVGSSDNFGKKIAKQLDFAPKKTQMRGVAKDVEAIGTAATNTKKNLSPLKDEFRAIRAESRNIDLGDLGDDKQYKKGRAELVAYTKSLKMLQAQTKGNSTAEREFNASLVAGEKAAKNKLEIVESQRKALSAAQKVGVSGAAVVIGKAAIDPVKQFATDSMKILEEFDDKMAAVAAVVQPTTEQLKGLRKQAAALGASTRYDAAQAAEAMGELGSAGFTTQQIMIGIGDTLSLASAGALGLAEAAEISASSLNGFGMEVNQLGHVVDVFAIAAAKTNAGIQDIGETMKYAAPQAALFGSTIEETTALIGTMANAGIKGSSSGTALRSIFTRLAAPTGPAQGALDSMGVKIKDAKGKLRNIMEIMDDLQVKMGLNSEDLSKQKAFFARVAASGENVDQAIAKLKASGDKQADNIDTIKTLVGAEAMSAFGVALQNSAKTKQAVYAEMAGSYDQKAFAEILLQTTADNKNFDELRAAYADKSAAGQERFKKMDIFKYVSEATASYTEATGVINRATDGLAIQGASTIVGDDLALVQKTLAGFKDTDEQFAGQFKDVDFSSYTDGVDLLQALVKGTGDTKKGMFQFQAALKASNISVASFTGAGKNMANVMEDSLPGDIRNMESALDSLRLNSIEPFEPLIRGVIGAISGFANFLANMPEPVRIAIGALQMLVFALGGILLAGGSIGIIMFGFEQAAATAAIATTVLEGSTIALTGFFGTSLSAAAGGNPLTASLGGLRTTASTLFAPLTALKTLMFELGRAMMAQMMSPLGLTLIGLSALYLIFEALTPQFDVLGRLMGTLAAPFGFLYGFAKGIAKALTTLIAPLVKIGTVAAGFPFVSVSKSLAMAVDYFGQFATKGEAAGVAFVDYFAAPIVMAAEWIHTAWNDSIGRIQGYMDGLVRYALNIAQLLINALNHNPTIVIPNSWDGAVERITAGLQGLVQIGKDVAVAMVGAFNWAFAKIVSVGDVSQFAGKWITEMLHQIGGYLNMQFDFDIAGALIAQMASGEGDIGDYFAYLGKTFIPGLINTWLTYALSAYQAKFSGIAASLTGLVPDDIFDIEHLKFDKILVTFDRLQANAESLFATFRSGGDLISAAFSTFNDPNNTANPFGKTINLISNSLAGLRVQADAAGKILALALGGVLIAVLPTTGAAITALSLAVQFFFKTIGGIVVVFGALFQSLGNTIVSTALSIGTALSTIDLNAVFAGMAGLIDAVTTALGENLNVFTLFALIGSTLPLGFVFSKGALTKELSDAIPAFYKAIALLLPAGMGALIANGLSTDLIDGFKRALMGIGGQIINIIGTSLDWYGILERSDFDKIIGDLGVQFDAVKARVMSFLMGLYQIPSVKGAVDGTFAAINSVITETIGAFDQVGIAIRFVYGLLKTGTDIGGFHISIIDILGVDIAIKAIQGMFRLLRLDQTGELFTALRTSFQGVIEVVKNLREGLRLLGTIFQGLFDAVVPPALAFAQTLGGAMLATFDIIKSGVIDLSKFILTTLRAINPEIYDYLAGNAKAVSDKVVVEATKAGASAVAVAEQAGVTAKAIDTAVRSSEAVQGLSRTVKFLKYLSTTKLGWMVPYLEQALGLLKTLGKLYFSFPLMNINAVLGFIQGLPFAELGSFFIAMTKAAYNSNAIFMWLGSSLKNLAGDGGKVLKFLTSFEDIYAKTKGFSDFGGGKGIKVFTPLDMLYASSRKFNSELNKVSVTKLFKISGSLERGVGASLELGNILKNFGQIQRFALLPGVISYIAAWAGAGMVIFPILKGLFKAMTIGFFTLPWGEMAHSIGQAVSDGIRSAFVDHDPFAMLVVGMGVAIVAMIGLWASGMSAVGAVAATTIGGTMIVAIGTAITTAVVGAAAILNGGLNLDGATAGIKDFNQNLDAKTAALKAINEKRAIEYRLRADKLSATLGRKVLATEIDRLSIYDRIKEMVSDTGDFFKSIPGKIAEIFGTLKDGLIEIGASVLALIATFAILGKFMGKDIRLIIGTAFGSVADGAENAKRRAGLFNPIEKIRLGRSDRQVDKDRVAINKESFDLKASNSAVGRSLAALANKTGKTKIEIIPEYERAARAEKMPRRAELNLLDREVLRTAEENLRQSKAVGSNGKSGRFAKFSTAQLEAESAAVFRNEKQIRAAAFNVANSGEAGYQTDKNINLAAIEQLKADPTISTGKNGKYTKNQIEDQETKIRADKTQMAKLSVGKAFADLAGNMTLAGTEALKGLGQDTERQKFIDGGELIDEDLTIKAKTVQLFVDQLGIDGADLVKKGQMTDAAMIVANRQVAGGDKLRELKLDRSAVEAVYKSFSRTQIRADAPNPDGENSIRFGSGRNIPAALISQNNNRRVTNADPDLAALDRNSSLFNGLPNNREGMGSFVSSNITRAQTENLSAEQSAQIEAQMILQLKELSLVFENLAGEFTYRENPETGRYELDPTILEAIETMGRVATGDGSIKVKGAAEYLSGKSADDAFAKGLQSKMPGLIESIYGKNSNLSLRDYSRTTGAFDPATSSLVSNNLGNLDLLKQVMVDLIAQLNARKSGGSDPLIQGREMAMVAKLFAGNKPELPVKNADPDPDAPKLDSKKPDFSRAFQTYSMSAQGVKPGDVNYEAINAVSEAQRQRVLTTMAKDFDFFEAANQRFAATIGTMDRATDGKGLQALDLMTSPDLVSDLNFSKLVAGLETDLPPEIDKLLRQTFLILSDRLFAQVTPAMRKDGKLTQWQTPDARRATAAASMVGMDIDAEVQAGLNPTDLAIKAVSVRQEMGIALKSFMALAIPDNKEIKAAMTLAYKQMGVGNSIEWDEVLPAAKGAKPVDNIDRYRAIAASFNRSPAELSQQKSDLAFVDAFEKALAQDKQNTTGTRSTAAALMGNVVKTALMSEVYSKEKFNAVVEQLGLAEEIKNSNIIRSSQAAIAAASPQNKIKVEGDANMNALGQAYLKRILKQKGLGSLSMALLDNTPENQEKGFNDFTSAISGANPNLPTGKQDFAAAMTKMRGASQKSGIEGVLSGLLEAGSDPREHAEKIRTSAILIANGQLDLLAPDVLMAVAKHTGNSVANLIRPDLDQNSTGEPVDRVKVNALRRLEVQRRLKQNGIDPTAFATNLGENSENLYKGRFGKMQGKDPSGFTDIAEILNANNKVGKEAEVELIASLSQQALLAKHQAELDKQKLQFFKNNKRQSAIESLYQEAAQQNRDKIGARENARAAGKRRYEQMLTLIVAQNPAKFEEMSAYGTPRAGIDEQKPGSYSTDPEVNELIGNYNLMDIFKDMAGRNDFLNEGAIKAMVENLMNSKTGRGPGELTQQLATKLGTLLDKLGIDSQQFSDLGNLDLKTMLNPADLAQAQTILKEMAKYEGKRRGKDIDSGIGVKNRSQQTALRLETLLMQMAPAESVRVADKDPKQTRNNNIDDLLKTAGIDVVNEPGKPKLAENFYKKALSGAKMPLDGVIAGVQTARTQIQSALTRIELEEPEVAKLMGELAAAQSELEAAAANKTNPIAALAKLIQLEQRVDAVDESDQGLGRIHEVAPGVLNEFFNKKSMPDEILPEIFGAVRDGSGAQAKMGKVLPKGGVMFDSSDEYQLAELAASLGNLTDGYQVHSAKLIELRNKFAAGSDGFYELLKDTTNSNLVKAVDDNKLYDAMILLYENAAGKGIDLKSAGLQYQLKNTSAADLGIDQSQLDLLRGFSDTAKVTDLTLDPSVRSAQASIGKGEMLDRRQLAGLKTATSGSQLEILSRETGLDGQPKPLDRSLQPKIVDLVQAIETSLGGEFNSGMKEDRELVDRLIANGVDKATALGEAIAQEYSVLYAYVDETKNKADASGLMEISSEGMNIMDKIAADIDPDQAASVKSVGIRALLDIVEGRRTTINKFNDGERAFLEAFQVEVGLSQKQLFNLETAIPKTRTAKIMAIGPQALTFFAQKYRKIEEQKTYSLNRFIQRSGLDYEQFVAILREEGFNSLQIQQILQDHDNQRNFRKDTKKNAQSDLIALLAKYGGMTKKTAKESIVNQLASTSKLDEQAAARQLEAFITAEIQKQNYTKAVEAKILRRISGTGRIATDQSRYAEAADTGLLLSKRIDASTEQMKKLAGLMGVDREKLDRLFTDKGGILGELAYASDYLEIARAAFDPLNLSKQLARIFSGGAVGNYFAKQVDKITAKRTAKLYAVKKSWNLTSKIVGPIIGTALSRFKSPAEAALNWLIESNANNSDWINKNLAGRIPGGEGLSKLAAGFESQFRDIKHQAQKIDEMPTIGKVSAALWERTGVPGLGRFIGRITGFRPADILPSSTAPQPPEVLPYLGPGGAPEIDATSGSIGGSDFGAVTAPPAPQGIRARAVAKISSIQAGFKRSFTPDGAEDNTASLIFASVDNPLNQALKGIVEGIGMMMKSSAEAAIEATGGTQIVTARDEAGVRAIVTEQRNPLRTLQKKAGQMLIDYASPMGNLYKLLGGSILSIGTVGVGAIELLEKGIAKSQSSGLTDKVLAAGRKAKDLLIGGFDNIGSAMAITLGDFDGGLVLPALTTLKQTIQSTIGNVFSSIGNAFESLTGMSSNTLKNALNSVFGTIKGIFASFKNIGRKVAEKRAARTAQLTPAPAIAPLIAEIATVATARANPDPNLDPIDRERSRSRRDGTIARRNGRSAANEATADELLAASGYDSTTGLPVGSVTSSFDTVGTYQQIPDPFDDNIDAVIDPQLIDQSNSVGSNPIPDPANPVRRGRTFMPEFNARRDRSLTGPLNFAPMPTPDPNIAAATGANPVPDTITEAVTGSNPAPANTDATAVATTMPPNKYDLLDEDINKKIEENWDGTSDAIIKNIKNLALVSKKLGYWIMRNLSEGSPGPTYYMRQHYADTTDFIEADLKRLVTVAQRSGSAIQSGLMGNAIDLDLSDLPKVANVAIDTATANPTVDDEFTGAVSQAEQFQSANVAAANLAANAAVVQDHTQNTADAMMDVAKGEVKVDQKGRRLFRFFTIMGKVMKFVPKGVVKMGQVFKKISKPVMIMGAGLSAAGFAVQNISSNLSTLGLVNEQQEQMIQKGSAVMEIMGGIGAIGGAAIQVLTGGFVLLLESGAGLVALALNPITYAVVGIGAAIIASIFVLNELSKAFFGFNFIAPVFGGIEGSISSLWSFIGEKLAPMVGYLRFQFAQAFGYDALAKLDGAISWLSNAWSIGFTAIGNGLKWLQGMMTEASTHISGVVGVLAIVFAPLIAVGWLTYKLFEALFNAIAPGLAKLTPILNELALKFKETFGFEFLEAFGLAIGFIVQAWAGGLGKIVEMMIGMWRMAEQVGNWLIGALNCNPTVQIPLAWQGATDNIMGMMNYLPDHAKATADKMVGFFGSAFDWLGGKKPEDIESKVGLTKTTTESTIVDPISGGTIPVTTPSITPPVASVVTPSLPIAAIPGGALPKMELPDWMQGIQSFAAEKMASFGISAPASPDAPLPIDTTGSLDAAKGVQSALTSRAADIGSRKGLLLHAGAEHKAERMDAAASGIGDLVSQSEYLQAEYQDLANPQGWKKQLAWFDKLFGSTQKRTKEIITQRGEIEKTLKTVVEGAKADLSAPIGGDLLVRLGVDPDALDTAGTEIQAGITSLGEQMVAGIQSAVAPAATYWDDAMTSIAEVGVGGTAEAIFGHALWNISEGVGTCGMAFKDLGGEVFESLKTMDFKRLANAGKMFTSTMGEGLGQIARGFQDAANGAAFFAAFSVTSGFLPALIFGGLVLLLVYLTLKFGNLREIASGAFQVISGAAKVFLVALQSIKPIVERLGDVFKGVFAAIKGDFNPLKTAITNLKLEFGIMFAKMGPGFAQIKDGFEEMKKGFQPVIDEGIIPMLEGMKAAFGRMVDFILDPFRKAISGVQQFGVDLVDLAANIVKNVQAEFGEVFKTIGGAAKFAFESVQGFFDDFGRGIRNIVDIVATTIADIGSIFTTGIADITGAFKAAWEGIGIGTTGIEGIGSGIKLVAGEVAKLGGNILSSLGGATEGIRSEIGKIGASFIETNKDLFASFETGFDRIGQLLPNLFKIFSDGINDFTAYFTVKFQGIIDFVTGIFDGIGRVASKAWDLAGAAFGKFNDLATVGIAGIQAFADEQFGKMIGEVFGGIGDKGKAAFDNLLLAAQPMTDGLKAIFTGTVRDLDNLVQSGLDGFNGMADRVATGFSDAFTSIKTTGADLSANLIAIPSRIGTAFTDMTGSIGSTLMNEFESAKTSGAELLNALKGSFADGTNQIGVMISGITTSFATVGDSITATIENLKATFSGLGEAIDTAMGSAFGGVKEKWQKTTGFMGKLMGKVAGDSEETGQLILHNMAENSPGPTQRIRELYALTATSVNNSLDTIAAAAGPVGDAIVDGLNPAELGRMEQRMNEMAGLGNPVAFGPQPASAASPVPFGPQPAAGDLTPGKTKKEAFQDLGSNTARATDFASDMLSFAGQEQAAGGFKAISMSINGVNTALDAARIAKEVGEDFKVLSGVMKGFSAVEAAEKVGGMATSLVESGKAAWEAVKGFGQWIMSKLFQTSVAVTAEATTAGAAVAGATATAGANTVVATTNAVAGSSFLATAAAAVTAWAAILAPILPIILAIGALVGIIYFLGKAMMDNNFLGFGDLMYGIGDAVGWVWNIFTGFLGALWNGGMEIIGGVFGTLMTTIGEIGGMFTSLGKDLAAPFMELFAAVGALFAPIVAMFPQMNGGLSATSMLVNVLLMPFKLIGESLGRTIWLIGMLIKGIVFVAGIVIKILVAPFMSIIKVITGIVGIFNMFRNAVLAIGGAVWSAIVSPFEFVTNLIKGIADQIGSLFSGPLGFLGGVFGMSPKVEPGAEVQQFSTGGYVSGAGGPTDDKIPAMLSNGEFVIGAAATARNRTFLEAINAGMPVQEALQLMDVPHPIGELPDRASVAAGGASAPAAVTVENHYAVTVSFGDIVVQGATGEEAAQDFSRFLQSTEFQMAVQAALASQVESMR